MTGAADDVGPLLSSVSVMLAAFGVFYTAQRDRIDAAIEDTTLPDDTDDLRTRINEVARHRNVAAALALAALSVWALLVTEVVERVEAAFDAGLDLGEYSTPDAVFFVAANAWLLLAIYIGTRWWALRRRRETLDKHLQKRT